MKKVQTFNSTLANVEKYDARTYAILGRNFLPKKRLDHLVNDRIASLTAIRPTYLYKGELEVILFDPLYAMAMNILGFTNEAHVPGSIPKKFIDLARRYALVAEVVNLAGVKSMINALGDDLLDSSHLVKWMRKENLPPDDKNNTNEHTASQILRLLNLPEKDFSDERVTEAQNFKNYVSPDTPEDSFQSTFDLLQTYGGQGRGTALPLPSYRIQIDKYQIVELAIKACLDPSMLNLSKVEDAPLLLSDGYALATAYLVYLYHSSTVENYDAIFPPAARIPLSTNRMSQIQQTARRAAWFYSGLANAPAISDLVFVIQLIEAGLDFLDPVLVKDLSEYKDLTTELSIAKELLAQNTVSPIQYHTESLLDKFRQVSGADVVIPAMIAAELGIQYPKAQDNPIIRMGFSGFHPNTLTRSILDSDKIQRIFLTLFDIIRTTRQTADSIAHSMNSFLTAISEYDPNALNIPNEVFAVNAKIIPAAEIKYINPLHKEFIPMSIKKYVNDPSLKTKNGKVWALQAYQYGTVDLVALKNSLNPTDIRYVFSRSIAVPLKSSLATRFAKLPIPYNYVSDAIWSYIPNKIQEVITLMKGENVALTHPSQYFEDLATVILTADVRWRNRLVDAVSGLCLVYEGKMDEPDTFKLITPTLPAIYGMPTAAFVSMQPTVNDLKEKLFSDQVYQFVPTVDEPTPGTSNVIVFVLHSYIPKPTPMVSVNAILDDGVLATVPMSVDFLNLARTKMFKSTPAKAVLRGMTDKKDETHYTLGALIRATAAMPLADFGLKLEDVADKVLGWAPAVQFFPHLFFDYQMPAAVELAGIADDFDKLCYIKLKRIRIPASRSLKVQAERPDHFVMIEPSDAIDIANTDDETLDSTLVTIGDAKDSDPSHGQTPKGNNHPGSGPDVKRSETTLPPSGENGEGAPTTDKVRDVVTSLTITDPSFDPTDLKQDPSKKQTLEIKPTDPGQHTVDLKGKPGAGPGTAFGDPDVKDGDKEDDKEKDDKKKKKKKSDESGASDESDDSSHSE